MRGNDLKTEFSKYGEVVFARVNLDRETKKSKGFGFVEFQNPADAAKILLRLCIGKKYRYQPWWATLSIPIARFIAPIIRLFYQKL